MSLVVTTSGGAPAVSPATRRRRGVPGLRGTGALGHAAAAIVVLAAIVAVAGPWLAPHDPDRIDLANAFVGSSPDHLLGLDAQGRDILSRLLVGARASLLGPLLVVVLSVTLGTALAIVSAWRRGLVDSAVSSVLDVLFAFPGILLAVLAAAVFGPSLTSAAIALSIAYTPYLARVVRSAAIQERSLPYIASLEVQGHSATSICLRHLVPNVLPLVVAQATIVFGYAMVDLAAISFIGLGIQPPSTDWGQMVATGQGGALQGYLAEAFAAGFCIVIVVVAFNILGDRLADRAPEHR
jgi:peptide/nickel transport system permease protein